jgi:replicative DNA helicase
MLERIVPHDLEAEMAVLGALLIDPDAIVQIADLIQPEDFYRQAHGLVYAAVLGLYERSEPSDIVMVASALERNGNLDAIGGRSFLSGLSNHSPTSVHVEHYASIIHRKAILRSLITTGSRIAGIAYEDPPDVDDAIDRAEEELYKVSVGRVRSQAKTLKTLLLDAFEKIEHLYDHRGEVTGIPSGFRDIDVLTQGFQPSDLIILAARPSVGKTSFALNVAEFASLKAQKTIGLFSLEMSAEQLILRLIASVSGVDTQRMRSGYMHDEDFHALGPALSNLANANIFIDDTPSMTVTEMRTKARRIKAEFGMDMLVVDYLQLMHSPSASRDANRVQEVSAISRGLKQLARELQVPVLALSQLSRATEGRDSNEPRLSDLRDSGAIEQDADVVLFLWRSRPTNADDADDPSDGEWINVKIAKHRNGPTGETQLWFRKSQTRFHSMDRGHAD